MKSSTTVILALLCVSMMVATSLVCVADNGTTNQVSDAYDSEYDSAYDTCNVSDGKTYFTRDGLNYYINDDGATVTLCSHDDDMENIVVPDDVEYEGKTYTVTVIGSDSLKGKIYEEWTHVYYPHTVEIGPKVQVIGPGALIAQYFTGSGYHPNLKSFTIRSVDQSELKEISTCAFQGQASLEHIVLPAGIECIDDRAFEGCKNCEFESDGKLDTVSLPLVKTLGNYAFKECCKLKTVILPSVQSMGKKVFEECKELRTVVMDSLLSIGNQAFKDCKNLQTVDMKSVTEIRKTMFEGYKNLETINFPSAKKIGQSAFDGCVKLKNVNIDSATYIDSYCFKNCESLEKIDLKSVTYVSYKSFESCDNLREVNMPVVNHISGKAFYRTSSLTNVVFSENLGFVGGDAFPMISFFDGETKLDVNAANLRGHTFIGSEGKLVMA